MKTMDLEVRPIHHRLENRVRAHIFLCMLAYYVEWHMREAWRSVLFCDEDQARKQISLYPAGELQSKQQELCYTFIEKASTLHANGANASNQV